MKGNRIFTVLKTATLAMKASPMIPLFMAACVLLDGAYGWPQMAKHWILLLAVGFLGYFSALWVLKRQEEKKAAAPPPARREEGPVIPDDKPDLEKLAVFAAGLAVALVFSLVFWPGILRRIAAFLLLYVGWVRFARSAGPSYSDLYGIREYMWCAGFYLAAIAGCTFLQSRFGLGFEMPPLVFSFVLTTVAAGVVINQANIDQMMDRRRHSKASLPQKIRLYNMALIIALLLLLVVAYIFREPIFSFLKWAGGAIVLGIVYGVYGFFYLIGLLMPDGGGSSGGQGGSPADALAGLPKGEASPIWDILFIVAMVAIVIFFATKGRKILRVILDFFSRLWNKLVSFLLQTMNLKQDGGSSEYYSDAVENLRDIQSQEDPSIESRNRREWKKAYKAWSKITDPIAKVRRGYQLLIQLARSRSVPLAPSDTTGQISSKASGSDLERVFEDSRPLYEQVRYAQQTPPPEAVSAFQEELRETLLAKPKK